MVLPHAHTPGGAKSSVNHGRPFVTYFVQPQCTPKTTIYGQRSSFVSSCSNKQIQIKRCVFRPRWYISTWDLSANHWNVAISQYLIAAMTCQLDNREKCFKYGIQPLSDLRVSRDKMTFRFFVCVRLKCAQFCLTLIIIQPGWQLGEKVQIRFVPTFKISSSLR